MHACGEPQDPKYPVYTGASNTRLSIDGPSKVLVDPHPSRLILPGTCLGASFHGTGSVLKGSCSRDPARGILLEQDPAQGILLEALCGFVRRELTEDVAVVLILGLDGIPLFL